MRRRPTPPVESVTMESKATLLDLFVPPLGGGLGGAVILLSVAFFLLLVRREAAAGLGAVDVVEALGAPPSSSIGSNVRSIKRNECQVHQDTKSPIKTW